MSLDYENSSQEATLWDKLIAANGQAMEIREQVPYQPVIYAIPEEWRLAEKALLEEAVKFQPELYQLIRQQATRQEFQQMQDQQLRTIQAELLEQTSSIRRTLQQDGSVREEFSSDLSRMLSDSRGDMRQFMERLENKIRKLVICTAVSSVALSVLVCMALQHWVG